MSSFSAYTLSLSLPVVHEQCDLDKMQCHCGIRFGGRGISHMDIRLYQMSCCGFPTRCQLGNTICLPLLHVKSLLQESFVQRSL